MTTWLIEDEPASLFWDEAHQADGVFDARLRVEPIHNPRETQSAAALVIEWPQHDREDHAAIGGTIELTPAAALMLSAALQLAVAPHLKEE